MTSTSTPEAPALPVWRTCLDVESQNADHYQDSVNWPLLELIDGTPRRVLELGCATGHAGAVLKERFPGVNVTGIDINRAAADVAARRLDRVICARIEEMDFAAEGLAEQSFDVVIAGDILEHLLNPWRLLERVRKLLTPDGQLMASIPNVRNLSVVSDVFQNGRWSYQPQGLLDITHLRFFTFAEMQKMFAETGYRPEKFGALISPALNETYQARRAAPSTNFTYGRMTLTGVTPQELLELCTSQFLFRCRPLSAPAS